MPAAYAAQRSDVAHHHSTSATAKQAHGPILATTDLALMGSAIVDKSVSQSASLMTKVLVAPVRASRKSYTHPVSKPAKHRASFTSHKVKKFHPTAVLPLGDRIAVRAKMYLGDPYAWGGTSPNGFDCSGFTQYVFAQYGISLPHSAAGQTNDGAYVSEAHLKPGDLVFFSTYTSGISHVGIYIGNDQFISAAGSQIKIDSLSESYWANSYVTARQIG
ncbi:hypothetical protein B2M26_01580 [Ferroacidibacillus organovorans]|nr:hypothetical protein B2M26_01580 [Ferroacidibacillus organovorans]